MSPPVVYIAGPYRGPRAIDIEHNACRARLVAASVVAAGGIPLVPHANSLHFDDLAPAEWWLEATLEMLRRCDAVVVLPGWKHSEGTKGEIAEAERLGMPVYYCYENLRLPRAFEGHIHFDLIPRVTR